MHNAIHVLSEARIAEAAKEDWTDAIQLQVPYDLPAYVL